MSEVKINTADGEQWSRMYAMALKREQVILTQRDRLQEALRQIAALDYRTAATTGAAYESVRIARAALEEGGQDD